MDVFNFHFPELQQIEEEYVRLCGSPTALMNVEQFSALLSKLGFIPELCKQCFKYVILGCVVQIPLGGGV